MSEGTEAANAPKKEAKKQKPSFASKMALIEVIERKRKQDRVDYRTIAQKHGIATGSLRGLWVKFKQGRIDLGPPVTSTEKEIDAQLLHRRQLELCKRHKELLLNIYEGVIYQAGDVFATKGGYDAVEKTGISKIIRDIKAVNDLTLVTERGYMAFLEEHAAKTAAKEKSVSGRVIDTAETKISSATKEQIAIQALSEEDDESSGA